MLAVKKTKVLIKRLLSFFSLWSVPLFALASDDDQLTTILNNAVDYAQSGPARGFCLLAIIGSGYLWLGKGILPKAWAIGIIGGSGFIFGSSYIGQNVLGL